MISFSIKKTKRGFGYLHRPLTFCRFKDLQAEEIYCAVAGKVIDIDTRTTRNGSIEYTIYIGNSNSAFMMKSYANNIGDNQILKNIVIGDYIIAQGKTRLDTYRKMEIYLNAYAIQPVAGFPERKDKIGDDIDEKAC